ncbi:hypothetical protein V1264_016615 [Littorina saxatilis]|uniref:Uncharacterized protein n=1 Tax=Littorina saxatilis TaxID=31220 RepID=A0AAN9BHD1_9CAEN
MMQQDYWIGLLKVSGSNPLQAYWSDAKLLNQSLYAFNFQLDDVRHDCVRMRTAPVTRVADYPCLGDYYYVCQYNSVTNASQSSERTFHFDVTPDQVIDSPWSLQVSQCQDASCSQLRCSHACASTKSCRSFSYSHVIRACRLHGSDLTSLTSFASADKTWVSAEKQRNEPANCEDVVTSHPCVLSGVFTLHPSLSLPPFPVFCRMGDDDVNWLLLMRKTDNANFGGVRHWFR